MPIQVAPRYTAQSYAPQLSGVASAPSMFQSMSAAPSLTNYVSGISGQAPQVSSYSPAWMSQQNVQQSRNYIPTTYNQPQNDLISSASTLGIDVNHWIDDATPSVAGVTGFGQTATKPSGESSRGITNTLASAKTGSTNMGGGMSYSPAYRDESTGEQVYTIHTPGGDYQGTMIDIQAAGYASSHPGTVLPGGAYVSTAGGGATAAPAESQRTLAQLQQQYGTDYGQQLYSQYHSGSGTAQRSNQVNTSGYNFGVPNVNLGASTPGGQSVGGYTTMPNQSVNQPMYRTQSGQWSTLYTDQFQYSPTSGHEVGYSIQSSSAPPGGAY